MAQMNMIEAIRSAHDVMMERDPTVVVLGEDVGYFGGVFRCTDGLQRKYGEHRVLDAPIAEGLEVGLEGLLDVVDQVVGLDTEYRREDVETELGTYHRGHIQHVGADRHAEATRPALQRVDAIGQVVEREVAIGVVGAGHPAGHQGHGKVLLGVSVSRR